MSLVWFVISWLAVGFVVSVGWGHLARFPAREEDSGLEDAEEICYRVRVAGPSTPRRVVDTRRTA